MIIEDPAGAPPPGPCDAPTRRLSRADRLRSDILDILSWAIILGVLFVALRYGPAQ